MSLFDSIVSRPTPAAPKGIIYGPPGVGKTSFGASAPDSIIIDCENGAGAIKCQRTPYLCDWLMINQWLTNIEQQPHNFNVVVIDSIDWLLRRIEEHVSGCSHKIDATINRSHGGYGNGKLVLKNYAYQILLPILDKIVNRGIAVLLLAHSKRSKITDIDGITIEKAAPELPEDFMNVMIEWSDFVCLAKKGENSERVLITQETPQALAKNRYSMPEVINFNWNSFTEAIAQGLERNFNEEITETGETD